MKIISDTATLFSPAEGEDLGITVVPVSVAINGTSYKDYEEITSTEFLSLIKAGGVPTSSQPSVGDVLDVLETTEDESLFITVGDGLSGAYQTAVGAKNSIADNSHIHIVNSKTLAGPLRYIVKKAVLLSRQGLNIQQIKQSLAESIESSISFVIPEDFEFLKRSGRLTAITAKVGGREIPCKTLLIAVGLQPEQELIWGLGEQNWIHICGNCNRVHPMVEAVIQEGKEAGLAACGNL